MKPGGKAEPRRNDDRAYAFLRATERDEPRDTKRPDREPQRIMRKPRRS